MVIEHLYDRSMFGATVSELIDVVGRLEISVDADELAVVYRLRETLLAKSMGPLREFDKAQLYQLSKASSTKSFLERSAGLSPADAGSAAGLARKLGAMPETEARFVDGRLSSGQVRAVAANVPARLMGLFQAVEAELLDIVTPLSPTEAATAMANWAIRAHALVDADDAAAPRDDEFFHSKTLGDRYVAKGGFGALTGATIATALKLAEGDNPRDGDTRSPAQRRGEALADVCGFYVDYRTRTDADPDAPSVPKSRNWPQLITVTSDTKLEHRDGGQILDGPGIDHCAVEALSCTAQLLRLVLDEDGAIRRYELLPASITDALFGAIAARDQGCRWPGCHKKPIHCDLHHLQHRAKGGKNSPCNCCLFCKFHHHRAAHDRSIILKMTPDGALTITYADGTTETTIPPIHAPPLPLAG
jgi:hypothetical protein